VSWIVSLCLQQGGFNAYPLQDRINASISVNQWQVRFYTENGRFAFFSPPLGLGDNVRCSYQAHWKDFLSVLIELFLLGWGATSEYRLKIGDFASTASVWHKFSGRRSCPTNHSSCHKTRVNDLSYGIRMRAQLSFVLSQITRLTDGRTDRQTNSFLVASPRWHSMQRVKKRTLCLFDRLRVGESNGQNADRLDWQPYHCQVMVSRMARIGIAATYYHFRWSALRPVGIKAVTDCWRAVKIGKSSWKYTWLKWKYCKTFRWLLFWLTR